MPFVHRLHQIKDYHIYHIKGYSRYTQKRRVCYYKGEKFQADTQMLLLLGIYEPETTMYADLVSPVFLKTLAWFI